MASEEMARASRNLPDYLVNFVDFKREMVRLDYTAEQLRKACQEVEERRVRLAEGLRREEDQLMLRQQAFDRRKLEDETETLRLQTKAREMAERKRVLLAEVEASRQLLEELGRKRNKLRHWLDGLEEHRLFLSEIIAHKVSPRTPRTVNKTAKKSRLGRGSVVQTEKEDPQEVEVIQSPGMIRSRLSHKERNVIAQSRILFQACRLAEHASPSTTSDRALVPSSSKSADDTQDDGRSVSNWDKLGGGMQSPGMQCGLNEQNYATIHRLFRQFIAPKSSSCDALANFAALERYAYYVLQMVDACDPAMLKKIIAKVVVDKRKTMEQQKQASEAAHRQERERKALANAMSAPAIFRRVTIVSKKHLQRQRARAEHAEKLALLRHSTTNSKASRESSSQEIDLSAPIDDVIYLFRFQL